MTERLIAKMIDFSCGNRADVCHFLKVCAYARTIGQLEHLDARTQRILELSAVVHDIACPLCREKYGSTDGKLQERESAAILRPFLAEFSLEREVEERIVHLVSHHHTYTGVDGMDWQILLEADFLVNADESCYAPERIVHAEKNLFRTPAGKRLLRTLYPEAWRN